ncbi:hypothetical protein GCM10011395_22500 [Sphingomonas psychrolutea]|uniref:Uncharacterized protein n=2 Tax=Sphingomonas psychrolutea TaxID=1259676 RepID=A0ABQ1GX06_9SPHN|nr:hypothetical protein GCM10011395_22500 [Sphingomonas psychrolutea]
MTGGGSGLGKGIATAIAARGAAMHICGRRANLLEDAAKAIAPRLFPTEGAWRKLNPLPGMKFSATNDDTVPLGLFGAMAEFKNLIVLLLSDGCSYLTGQTVAIGGGRTRAQSAAFADRSDLTDWRWQDVREMIQASSARDKANRA